MPSIGNWVIPLFGNVMVNIENIKQNNSILLTWTPCISGWPLPPPRSGFTALTEKYTLSGRGGTDKLTETLNSYIGALVECILRRDGDVLQFAGQLVWWERRLITGKVWLVVSVLQFHCTVPHSWNGNHTYAFSRLRSSLSSSFWFRPTGLAPQF